MNKILILALALLSINSFAHESKKIECYGIGDYKFQGSFELGDFSYDVYFVSEGSSESVSMNDGRKAMLSVEQGLIKLKLDHAEGTSSSQTAQIYDSQESNLKCELI